MNRICFVSVSFVFAMTIRGVHCTMTVHVYTQYKSSKIVNSSIGLIAFFSILTMSLEILTIFILLPSMRESMNSISSKWCYRRWSSSAAWVYFVTKHYSLDTNTLAHIYRLCETWNSGIRWCGDGDVDDDHDGESLNKMRGFYYVSCNNFPIINSLASLNHFVIHYRCIDVTNTLFLITNRTAVT